MNSVVLLGRLTRDVELRVGDTSVARFGLAVARDKKDETDFFNCVAFGKQAEFIEKYFSKGSRMCLRGKIRIGSYEKDGRKISTCDIIAEQVDFVDTKAESPKKEKDEWVSLDDSGLPFN